jgi:cell division protein FtsL
MSPAEAVARPERAARTTAAETARAGRPALRSTEAPATRRSRLIATLSQPNLLGRIGTLAVGALFLSIFGVVVFQALLVQGQARLDHLNGQIATQQQDQQQLQAQVAQLESPSRIVTYARNNLHMVDPGNVVYLQQTAADGTTSALAPTTTTLAATPGSTRP